jgi:GTP cyclohydrolase I
LGSNEREITMELDENAIVGVKMILRALGEDPERDGLRDTPKRVVKALKEMTTGYVEDPATILGTTFDVPYDEMIILKDIPFVSMCEHHMLAFKGTAAVGYIPTGRVVGLSKLARVVDTFAKRLQVQERLTSDIAHAIQEHVAASGVGVVIKSHHTCMSNRGVKKTGEMVTSVMLGSFRAEPETRNEFLKLISD